MMLQYTQFAVLRLRSFLTDVEMADLTGWEFEGRVWVGEAVGFSEWLRLEEEPDILRSLALDLSEIPAPMCHRILQTIRLPLRAGMTAEEIRAVLGEPLKVLNFAAGRTTYEYRSPGSYPYKVSCTVLHDGGLSYLVVMAPMPADNT